MSLQTTLILQTTIILQTTTISNLELLVCFDRGSFGGGIREAVSADPFTVGVGADIDMMGGMRAGMLLSFLTTLLGFSSRVSGTGFNTGVNSSPTYRRSSGVV